MYGTSNRIPETQDRKGAVSVFEKRNGKLDPKDALAYQKLAEELNMLGEKTVTGLPYTKTRCQALVIKMRKRFKEE